MGDNLIKEEWIAGIVMMSPRPPENHMELMSVLGNALTNYFGSNCKVRVEGALFLTKESPKELKNDLTKLKALISSKKAELVPDIAVYCDKDQRFRRGFLGVPQLIVEVLSPSNILDDTVKKKSIYEEFGVPEYWIADTMSKRIIVFSLEDGKYAVKGDYNFLEEEIKSARFDNLSLDIKSIDLLDDEDFDI